MSSPMRIAFLGDVVGQPGKRAAVAAAKVLRAAWGEAGGVILANGENIRNGSGITPELLGQLVHCPDDAAAAENLPAWHGVHTISDCFWQR
jgi:calcineurin-like phosphoesterase